MLIVNGYFCGIKDVFGFNVDNAYLYLYLSTILDLKKYFDRDEDYQNSLMKPMLYYIRCLWQNMKLEHLPPTQSSLLTSYFKSDVAR